MIHLVTFSDSNMTISAEILKESARRHGVQNIWYWRDYALKQTDFYEQNKEIIDSPRGCGYWAWKPYIILESLKACDEGDILIYSDAGVEIVNSVHNITGRMKDDIWLFGNMWQHQHWCKGDVQNVVGNAIGKQAQASVIFMRNTGWVQSFIENWLNLCTQKYLIDDSPSLTLNHPEFKEHRHDQAILTSCAFVQNIPLHWWPAMYNAGNFTYEKTGYPASDNYPIIFHHHRRRNEEWKMTDDLNRQITNYFTSRYKIAI